MPGSTADRHTQTRQQDTTTRTSTASATHHRQPRRPAPRGCEPAVEAGRVLPTAQVLVTVPVFALMGLTDEPADLDGYGPIPPSMARELVADGAPLVPPGPDRPPRRRATGDRTGQLPDPRSNAPMAAHAGRQMPVPRLQQPVPGQRSRPHPGLGQRRHHRHLESRPALPQTPPAQTHHSLDPHRRQLHKPPGWTSPTGRHYPSEHHDWEPPHWPTQILEELRV